MPPCFAHVDELPSQAKDLAGRTFLCEQPGGRGVLPQMTSPLPPCRDLRCLLGRHRGIADPSAKPGSLTATCGRPSQTLSPAPSRTSPHLPRCQKYDPSLDPNKIQNGQEQTGKSRLQHLTAPPVDMRRRGAMLPETAQYTANYILSKPRSLTYDPLYSRRYVVPVLESFCTPHQGKGGYWMSPQRYHVAGSCWHAPKCHLVVFPGNTGFSDVPSSLLPGHCCLRNSLV
ncbi:uncharacterized protein LOC102356998 [Arapaima gigas]